MSEMVEKVARAIDPGAFMPMSCHVSVGARNAAIESAMQRARWAIEAMREPTEDMDVAGAQADQWRSLGVQKAHRIWFAMIDAALTSAETPGQTATS